MYMEKWEVEESDNHLHDVYIENILEFLLLEYSRIFGEDTMNKENCIVYNDSASECPMLIINMRPIRIRLSQKDPSYLVQMIFQLSHELCHYAIRQHKNNKEFTLNWFEEIVCEAMSLYALKWSSDNWFDCKLSQISPNFSSSIRDYLTSELNKDGTDEFKKCNTIALLKHYEKTLSTCRETHRNERNKLYYEIIKNPLDFACVCDYCDYVEKKSIMIDFENWKNDDSRKIIDALSLLQPCAR